MQHVAADADLQPLERSEVIAQREHVEQPLRRMLVRAVARVDDVRLDAVGEKLRRARCAVTDHDHVDPHRLEIARGIDERLALARSSRTTATLTVSAERRFSANSNEMRVRVEASKKRLTIVEPRSAGTFLIARSLISLNGSAVSRMRRIWSPERGSRPSRSFPSGARHAVAPRGR